MRKPSTHNLIILCIGVCLIIISYLILSFQMYTPSYEEMYKVSDSIHGVGKILAPKVAEATQKVVTQTNQVNQIKIFSMKAELLSTLIVLMVLIGFYFRCFIETRFTENERRSYENHKSTHVLLMKGRKDV